MDIRATGTRLIILSIVFILQNININPQSHYLDKYSGIPIIAHTNLKASQISNDNLDMMKELGVMGFYATDINQQTFNRIIDRGLKVFPYQIETVDHWVVYYTDAVYTKWEAEGKGNGGNGDMELKYNPSIGTIFTEENVKGIKTTSSNPSKLIYGPWYYQAIKYKQLPLSSSDTLIQYTAAYRLKIKNKSPINNLPQGYLDSVVCKIEIVATNPTLPEEQQEHTVYQRTLKVSDFLNSPDGKGWDQWCLFTKENYTLNSLMELTEIQLKGIYYIEENQATYDTKWMQYKVEWAGRSFVDLFVDYIELSDEKGRDLKNDPNTADLIKYQVIQYSDTTNVLGWFGLNEPTSIDNYEPFRIVDSLIQSVNPNLRLFTTYATGWGGIYGMPYPGSFDASQLSSGVYIYNIQTDGYFASQKMILMK